MNQLDQKLYLLFSDKTLSEGCKIIHWFTFNHDVEGDECIDTVKTYDGRRWVQTMEGFNVDEFKILGHEPQLHDVFKLAEEKSIAMSPDSEGIHIGFWDNEEEEMNWSGTAYNFTLPLLQQEDSTKEQLINLFK